MAPRRAPVHPALALTEAREAAKAAAAEKARRAPHTLTEAEVRLLPRRKVLELGNADHLRHLGVGTEPLKPATPAAAPKASAAKSARAPLSNADLRRMSGAAISKAMAVGLVPGVGPRRRPRNR